MEARTCLGALAGHAVAFVHVRLAALFSRLPSAYVLLPFSTVTERQLIFSQSSVRVSLVSLTVLTSIPLPYLSLFEPGGVPQLEMLHSARRQGRSRLAENATALFTFLSAA